MPVEFARPLVADMRFVILGRSVHPELFDTFQEVSFITEGIDVQIRICGSGHVCHLRGKKLSLSEVVSGNAQALPKRRKLLDRKLHGSSQESLQLPGGMRYHYCYQTEQLDPLVFQHMNEELHLDRRRAALYHEFPTLSRFAPHPLTLIKAESSVESLLLNTFHTFPEESTIVKTQSLFEF